ncbi:uncharacterized protein LOC122388832 isoform X1 [Amphibalanus amphitrite]|uniref:uncharacterized protein LOC122373708 isoform X1 n=1 Tax=Amphibalanus amphitrite TaxID=1232801 RepID=UPI001C91C9CB|nr:uncharacterized protein LOC122373708 isoform X1 [Amphibalanus amphitrite]XP_043207959.1 uncharacterized protein LOC122373708 isoform X1 [Amphibalanus amphitrite]XP_043236209.1 uncharacterized protein LOC122388832 isoform X1 [Amphibalanus amphitrite]XP_043236210.1 uncharacterized protein LOC122388832 isoform X1 [Amphibalanus amphitrite]
MANRAARPASVGSLMPAVHAAAVTRHISVPLDLPGRCTDAPAPAAPPPVQPAPAKPSCTSAVAFSPMVPADTLHQLLSGYNEELRHYLVSGFRSGFSTGSAITGTGGSTHNLPSCDLAPQIIDDYVSSELKAGRLAGPFAADGPSPVKRISPIGLVPKKSPGSFRVIHHLSFPAGESINDYIPREFTAVQYGSLDEAVEYISHFDHAFLAKSDIVQAFRLLPTTERDSALLGFRWRGLIYADRALPMGCASSAQIFQTFSDALVWIAQRHFGAGHIVAVLDDFLFIGASKSACASSLRGFTAMCHLLNVPLHPDKTVLPCQRLTFLGVELDVAERVLRLPTDKVERARDAVADLSRRRKAPLRQVQTCIGLLNFACLAVPLGRPFLRRLSDLCAGVRRPHHRVSLTRASRLDMSAWLLFLQHFNGRSLLDERRWTQAAAVCLETDASAGVGLGAICGSRWLLGTWPEWLQGADIGVLELVAVVVAMHVWASDLTRRCVIVRSDNSGVVAAINSQSSRSPAAMRWLRHLFLITMRYNILVRANHVPGIRNVAPDALSRGLTQVFREVRPSADAEPTSWDWADFAMLQT